MLSWKPVVEGLLEGVGIAVVFGAYSYLRSRCKRKKQKEWLGKIVSHYLEMLSGIDNKVPHLDLILKRASYKKMREEISAFLDHKAGDFTYKDEREVRNVFRNINLTLERNEVPSLEAYKELEKNLRKIKWLNL